MKYQQQGARLREIREASDRTLDDVGRHVGLSGPAVRHWETGRSKPAVDVARALDELYGSAGEVVGLYGYSPEPGSLTLADVDAKLDRMFEELRNGQVMVMGHVGTEIARATEVVELALNALRRQVASLDQPRQRNTRGAGSRR